MMDAWPAAHGQREHQFSGPWGVWNANFHGVKVATYIGGVDVPQRHIDTGPRAADFHGGGNYGPGLAEALTHGVSAGNVQKGRMF